MYPIALIQCCDITKLCQDLVVSNLLKLHLNSCYFMLCFATNLLAVFMFLLFFLVCLHRNINERIIIIFSNSRSSCNSHSRSKSGSIIITHFLSVLSFLNDLRDNSPVCIRAILGNYHLQLAESTHGCSVCAGGELKEEALLFLTKRVQRLPKLPSYRSTNVISDNQLCILLFSRLRSQK